MAKPRAELTPAEQARAAQLRKEWEQQLLAADPEDLFTVTPVQDPMPHRARLHASVTCADCGELTMETLRMVLGALTVWGTAVREDGRYSLAPRCHREHNVEFAGDGLCDAEAQTLLATRGRLKGRSTLTQRAGGPHARRKAPHAGFRQRGSGVAT